MKRATAYANANIALIKYWGKSDNLLNIPAVSSLSMTLSDLGTKVSLSKALNEHVAIIDGKLAPPLEIARLASYLEQVRKLYPYNGFIRVSSKGNVAISAGLASSASFYAALACALNDYLDLCLKERELSILARMGSGSAARSIFSYFAGLHGGEISHENACAFSINASLDLAMVIAIVSENQKTISSRQAMNLTQKTSPFFTAFIETHDNDFKDAINALEMGSFEQLGIAMEHSTLKMFSTMWAAQPMINYLKPNTLALIEQVYHLRSTHGPIAFFTMDAGPNVKILCHVSSIPLVMSTIAESNLALKLFYSLPGKGAFLMNEHLS